MRYLLAADTGGTFTDIVVFDQRTKATQFGKTLSNCRDLVAGVLGWLVRMSEAGLTKGGFYAHFESKDALVAETVLTSLETTAVRMRSAAEVAEANGGSRLSSIIEGYLSPDHVAARDMGCTIGSLLSDLTRGSKGVREAAAEGAAKLVEVIEEALPNSLGRERNSRVRAILGTLSGCLQFARLEADAVARDAVLAAGRRAAYFLADVAPEGRAKGLSA